MLRQCLGLLLVGAAIIFLGGCAGTTGQVDPWEKTNRCFYDLNDGLDKYAMKPLADGYVKVVWKPVRQCVSNGFDNLEYGGTIINDFLQGKWEQGWRDLARMGINSTIGVAGIFDVASPMGLVYHDNDFGITLGVWGFESGPYLVLPFFGPSSVRDAPSIAVGIVTDPIFWSDIPLYVTIPLDILEAVDARSRYEKMFKFRNAVALDPYVFTRDAYLQHRLSQINEGKAAPKGPSIYDEDYDSATQPSTQPATEPSTAPAAQSRPADHK